MLFVQDTSMLLIGENTVITSCLLAEYLEVPHKIACLVTSSQHRHWWLSGLKMTKMRDGGVKEWVLWWHKWTLFCESWEV